MWQVPIHAENDCSGRVALRMAARHFAAAGGVGGSTFGPEPKDTEGLDLRARCPPLKQKYLNKIWESSAKVHQTTFFHLMYGKDIWF